MLIAEARVESEQASRYLVQLCRHFSYRARTLPKVKAHVEWSDDWGVADFGWGRCTLRADPGVLTLRAEAADEATLQRVQLLVSDHVERFGKRDHLTVIWTSGQAAGEQPPRHTATKDDTHR